MKLNNPIKITHPKKFLSQLDVTVIIFVTAILIVIYIPWPWRSWNLENGIWQWIPGLSALKILGLFEARFHIVGSLFLIPILYSAIFLRLRYSLIIWLLSFCCVLSIIINLYQSLASLSINLSFLIVPVLISLVINIELKLRQKDKYSFLEREKERRLYLSKIIETQETERKRISQEIHDGTIQTLIIIGNKAESLIASSTDEKQLQGNRFIKEKISDTIEELRRLSIDLRPSVIDNFGLLPGLRWLVNCINEETKIVTQISLSGQERKLPSEVETAIFRVTQEALNNIRHHSQANTAKIDIKYLDESLDICIQDDGVGFDNIEDLADFALKDKFGLIGIKERIESLGGTFKIFSQSNKGTTIKIKINY
jgi:signal transduction histidine kinase